MVTLPPFRIQALAVLVGLTIVIFILCSLVDPGKPFPKTVSSALLLALFISEWTFISFGSVFSRSVRSWLYEPSPTLEEELEKVLPACLLAGTISMGMAGLRLSRLGTVSVNPAVESQVRQQVEEVNHWASRTSSRSSRWFSGFGYLSMIIGIVNDNREAVIEIAVLIYRKCDCLR